MRNQAFNDEKLLGGRGIEVRDSGPLRIIGMIRSGQAKREIEQK
jgi:hypothetical protein